MCGGIAIGKSVARSPHTHGCPCYAGDQKESRIFFLIPAGINNLPCYTLVARGVGDASRARGPEVKVREIVRAMKRDGWYIEHQAGSHRKFRHPIKTNRITIAYADSKEVGPDEARKMLREAGL
jgi:predicted RNA binding protein YcfA (HicA-like mRNA interferase family)